MKKRTPKSRKGLRAVVTIESPKMLRDIYDTRFTIKESEIASARIAFAVMLAYMADNDLLKNFLAITLREWADILTEHAPKKRSKRC